MVIKVWQACCALHNSCLEFGEGYLRPDENGPRALEDPDDNYTNWDIEAAKAIEE